MKTLGLLALFWVPFLFVLRKIWSQWKGWSDFVQVFVASAFIGATDRILDPDPVRMLGLGISAGIAGCSMLWAFGPGMLPAPSGLLTEGRREQVLRVWRAKKWLLLLALWVSLTSCLLWIADRAPLTVRFVVVTVAVALAASGVLAWRYSVRRYAQ